MTPKATNVGSTEAALNGLHVDGTLHLLPGGDGKSADFSPLARYLTGDRIRLYCSLGAMARSLPHCVRNRPTDWRDDGRGDAFAGRRAFSQVDMVLLSPACASLDQFKNFEQRAMSLPVWRRVRLMRLSLPVRECRAYCAGLLARCLRRLKAAMASRDKDADSLIAYDRTLLWLTLLRWRRLVLSW